MGVDLALQGIQFTFSSFILLPDDLVHQFFDLFIGLLHRMSQMADLRGAADIDIRFSSCLMGLDGSIQLPDRFGYLPESGDKRWDALIKGMKQAAAENNVHMIICNTEEIDGPEAEREFIREQKDNDIDGFIIYPAPGHETENMLKKECGNKPYLLIADGLAVKEGKTASPTIQPDYREIGRWLGEQLRTKKQKIGVIADWKMSEAVQAEICGLNEALEGSESKISWCIYRRKEQDIVERMKKETEADALVILDAGILEEFGEQAENGTYKGAELYGVGYSLKTIALLDNGNIQGLAVPDGYEIGYKSVEEITKRIEHRSYKMQGYITEYQVLGKENFSMDEDLERFLYSYE